MTASARSRSPSGFPDPTPINLNRLLSRLERAVLEAPSPQLRSSSYERARVGAVSALSKTIQLLTDTQAEYRACADAAAEPRTLGRLPTD